MIPRPDRPDPARLIADLGIRTRPDADPEEVLAALAATKAKRDSIDRALGFERPPSFPPDADPEERRRMLSEALDALPSTPWWEGYL